jgi:muramidase (phage lysozyme)
MIAFLEMLKWAEIGEDLLEISDDGYNVLVGSTASHPLLFKSYSDHPRVYNAIFNSTAAGAFQIIRRTFNDYSKLLNLHDFTPASQEAIALQLLKERHALNAIEQGWVDYAVRLASPVWASLPYSGASQPKHAIGDLICVFKKHGGDVC